MSTCATPSPQAVIFDVDGTLLDSVDFHAMAWVDALSDFGHLVPFAAVRREIGKGGDQLLPVFLNADELSKEGKALEAHRAVILKQRYLPRMQAFPKVRALFERVRVDRKKIALASSANADEVAVYRKIAKIDDLIDVQTSADDADRSKPCPDIFQAVAQRLGGVALERMIAIGDTPYDAQAAGKAGIRTIGMLSGGWSADELQDAGCVAVYDNPADLLARYGASPIGNS
jgi:HAD superfamily hydrolase (TIGR01549 family)